ncbi:DUF7535 family protein [Halorarius litoreus]|uniref:DUF7535 family protein n=1 Tax=Halorarius litoreus TaxID=2962676 RepID=UPI0020CF4CBB|nr:hypothetical protein [Halorarius litoreus]
MSSEDESAGPAARLVDTVTPGYVGRPDSEMHAIGLLLGGIMLVVLIPLLPFIAVLWAVNRLANARRGTDLDPNFTRQDRTRPS